MIVIALFLLSGLGFICYGGQMMTDPQKDIFNEVSWTVKILLLKDLLADQMDQPTEPYIVTRRVGVQRYVMAARREGEVEPMQVPTDDSDMKMKLFRLMYETVRDSDLKVKRAELINQYYVNSSAFEVGYLMGDVTDKFNIMSDISMTLKRLYNEWKPIEHINAYEQIANQAIEISHLIDIVRSVSKTSGSVIERY